MTSVDPRYMEYKMVIEIFCESNELYFYNYENDLYVNSIDVP